MLLYTSNGKEVAVSQCWGTADAAPHSSTSPGVEQLKEEQKEKALHVNVEQVIPRQLQHGSYNERDLFRSSSGGDRHTPPETGSYCLWGCHPMITVGVRLGDFTSVEVKPPGCMKPLGKYDLSLLISLLGVLEITVLICLC